MNEYELYKKLAKKANDKIQQQCTYRPFVASRDSTIFNDEWWKVFFGGFQEVEHGIKQADGSILLQEEWIYQKKKSGYYDNSFVDFLKYLEKFV